MGTVTSVRSRLLEALLCGECDRQTADPEPGKQGGDVEAESAESSQQGDRGHETLGHAAPHLNEGVCGGVAALRDAILEALRDDVHDPEREPGEGADQDRRRDSYDEPLHRHGELKGERSGVEDRGGQRVAKWAGDSAQEAVVERGLRSSDEPPRRRDEEQRSAGSDAPGERQEHHEPDPLPELYVEKLNAEEDRREPLSQGPVAEL